MQQTARVLTNGNDQTVALPAEFRFDSDEVNISKDPETGNVILSQKGKSLDEFFDLLDQLTPEERNEFQIPRDMTPVRIPNL